MPTCVVNLQPFSGVPLIFHPPLGWQSSIESMQMSTRRDDEEYRGQSEETCNGVYSWCLAMETCPSVDITTPASLMKIIGAINYSKYSWSGNETPVHHSPTCARLFCPTGHKRVSAVFSVSPSNLINQTKDAQFNKESHWHGIEAPLELGNTQRINSKLCIDTSVQAHSTIAKIRWYNWSWDKSSISASANF